MHAQSDLFHPQPKARWQNSSAELPLSSTGSLRASQAEWEGRVYRWARAEKVIKTVCERDASCVRCFMLKISRIFVLLM